MVFIYFIKLSLILLSMKIKIHQHCRNLTIWVMRFFHPLHINQIALKPTTTFSKLQQLFAQKILQFRRYCKKRFPRNCRVLKPRVENVKWKPLYHDDKNVLILKGITLINKDTCRSSYFILKHPCELAIIFPTTQ